MFALAVIGIVGGDDGRGVVRGRERRRARMPTGDLVGRRLRSDATPDELLIPLCAGGAALALIGGGSLFKIAQLRGGGTCRRRAPAAAGACFPTRPTRSSAGC